VVMSMPISLHTQVLQWISKNTMNTQHIGVETQFKQVCVCVRERDRESM
jgi:hypothetical protein